ncbi:protein PUF6, putative [Cordyceps militaris CM01]|uniref:Protein PUF6, putative n=1 Tax=Cordyceps militaris (strain CM01) TaxID=983644 RepID=G3JL89_CORMM|nr:protein PUF6, putative [Cordyceps militaris CM01]EGX90463.1 protein PUF6, putative [Cordyceps militaris CM01]
MATKISAVGSKRKATAGDKGKSGAMVKKARLDGNKKAAPVRKDVDEPEGSSDSEDGGVQLEDKKQKKSAAKDYQKPVDTGLSSRESHAKQKQLAAERKAAKPLADEVHRTKKIWERLRRKSHVPKEERHELVAELFTIITGRMKEFVLKHDAVRAVQTALKYSTPEQRKQIAHELDGSYSQLAESRYAKFLIGKLLVQNDDEILNLVVPNFYGRVRKLINHAEASWILDDIYRTVATKEQKASLLREWYGPEFTLKELTKGKAVTADLKEILADTPSKRGPIMKSLLEMINSLVQKRMTGFTMLHDAMLQYYLATEPGSEEFTEFLELIKGDETGDLMKNLAFTRSGSRLVCLMLAYGTAKDRKQLLKNYKDAFQTMAGDQYAHLVILTAYDVIDDTKLVAKSIFPELVGEKNEEVVENIVGAVNNPHARLTFLYLFEGMSKSLFPPGTSFAQDLLKEVDEIRKTTSKKDADARQQELASTLTPHLLEAIATAPSDLLSTAFGCQFIADVLLSNTGDKAAALEAVAQAAKGSPNEAVPEDELQPPTHVSQTPFGGRTLKSLIQGGRFDKAAGKIIPLEPALGFANILYPVIADYIVDWATGPSSFVVVALLEAGDFGEAEAVRKTLKKNKKLLSKAATEQTPEQKAVHEAREQAAAAAAEAGDKSVGKKKKATGKKKAEPSVGNSGSKLLLEKL